MPPKPNRDASFDAVIRCRQGEPLHLQCSFNGRPTPSVRWLRNGLPYVPNDSRIYVENVDGVGKLMISGTTVVEYSGGMYQCRAENTAGVSLLSTWVDIHLNGQLVAGT